jgi:hypothetical protein
MLEGRQLITDLGQQWQFRAHEEGVASGIVEDISDLAGRYVDIERNASVPICGVANRARNSGDNLTSGWPAGHLNAQPMQRMAQSVDTLGKVPR